MSSGAQADGSTGSAVLKRGQLSALDSSFTSFSDLGAAIPASSDDQTGDGSGGEASTSLWRLPSLKILLHPTKSMADVSNERTPLLQAQQQASRRRPKRKVTKRYVGGDGAFAISDAITEAELAESAPLPACRQCEARKTPISAVKLAIISHVLFSVMSLLGEVLARDKADFHMNEMFMLAIQSGFIWLISATTLLLTGTKNAFLGPPDLRYWIWARALCAALSTVLFAVASQKVPIMNLIAIVYLAPVFFNWISALFLSSPFPFRAQIVSLSLLLGLVLLAQPTPLFPDQEGYLTIPAAPIDLPPVGDYSLDIPLSLAYFAACASAFFMIISLGLLSRAVKISIYHSISSNSLLTALFSIILFVFTRNDQDIDMPTIKHGLVLMAIIAISFLAHLFQALALQRKSPRQLSLVSFVQPIFSTGLQTVFLDRSIDVLPLAGSVLIGANIAWMTDTLTDEEEDEDW